METEGSQPPLDSSMAPALLFCRHGEPSGGDTRFLYSIPKRRLLRVTGFGSLIKDVEWVTPQGWVLTLDPETRETSLRDPFSSRRAAVRLPPDRENLLSSSKDTRCVLSTRRPTDPGCVVLAIHQTDPVLFYCRHGSSCDRWSRHEYLPALLVDGGRSDIIIGAVAKPTAAGGRFYMHIPWGQKLTTLVSSSQVMDCCPMPVGCNFTECCLVESCEDLFLVQFCYTRLCDRRILRVEVKKLDWSRSAFVKVADLGINRVFSTRMGQFGASMPADELGLKPDCIYFSKSDDKGLYVYDMDQGTTSLYNPGQDVLQAWESILLMPVC